MSRIILPTLTGFALIVAAIGFTDAGDLATIRARKEAAAQKIKADVTSAIERSRSMKTGDARFLLESVLREVKDSSALEPADRAGLVTRLQARISAVNQADQAKKVEEYRPPSQPPIVTRPPVDGPSGGPSAVAKNFMSSPKYAVELHNRLIREREKGNLDLMLGHEKTVPIPGDSGVAFAANHKELVERQKKRVSQQLTDQEKKLLKTLNSTMSVNYDDAKFKLVLRDLEERTGLALIVDPNSERDLNLDYEDTIKVRLEKASVRTILKTVLAQKGLSYIIKEGNIQVMTPKRASEHAVVRAYQIDDLLGPPDPTLMMMYGPMYGQQAQQMKEMQAANQLIQLVMMTTDPNYWQPNGPGSIVYYAPTKTLLVRASTEMHYQMASPGMFGR